MTSTVAGICNQYSQYVILTSIANYKKQSSVGHFNDDTHRLPHIMALSQHTNDMPLCCHSRGHIAQQPAGGPIHSANWGGAPGQHVTTQSPLTALAESRCFWFSGIQKNEEGTLLRHLSKLSYSGSDLCPYRTGYTQFPVFRNTYKLYVFSAVQQRYAREGMK